MPDQAPPPLRFDTAADWAQWLAQHHTASAGVWLQIAKAGAQATSVTYAQALEVALCYGWIDGQKKADSDIHWLQRFIATLNRQNRYAILFRVQTAKKAETRARRIAQFVDMLTRRDKLYP